MKAIRGISALALACVLSVAQAQYAAPQQQPQRQSTTQQQAAQPTYNTGYYTNRAGQAVHRPERTVGNVAPAGASAQCRDGSYSFSRSRRGTCSHHGGVARWL